MIITPVVQVEAEVVETATWQADFQEVERVARENAAKYAKVAAETAALRANMMSAALDTSSASNTSNTTGPTGVSASSPLASSQASNNDDPPPPDVTVPVFVNCEGPPIPSVVMTSPGGMICNHERHVLRDLQIIEKQAMRDSNKFLAEAEAAAAMQRELASKVRVLEGEVMACELAMSNATHLREDAEAQEQKLHPSPRKEECEGAEENKSEISKRVEELERVGGMTESKDDRSSDL
mmetsp:Transcript_22523/g.38154  ORF Transcript_22523/g.38154 Transcript_22523/m.38154 type:complete len:238 (-) Transcript_22523:178-891(-)